MNVAEATRQYQVALEHERRGRTELGDVISAAGDLADAAHGTQAAGDLLFVLWLSQR
jgi:hypothetical protein